MLADSTGLVTPSGLPAIDTLMQKYKDANTNVVAMEKVQHEYIAIHWRDELAAIIKAFDRNRSTQAIYDALAWDGLEETDRYKDAGYTDKNMRKNRDSRVTTLVDNRKLENPCP
jgi:hypothetical protein